MNETNLELVDSLEERLGYVFADKSMARAALTHSSWVNEHPGLGERDNERLEFLGDAVIDLAVSQRLMERFPDATEGPLSRMRASLVNAEILAEVARELRLGELLLLGKGEERTGGRDKVSLLSNCLEAIIGALYLGGGLEPVHQLVDRSLIPRIEAMRLDLTGGRDYKTWAQEHVQEFFGITPRYVIVAEEGPDHEKVFTVELLIDDDPVGRGEGKSKKEAEQRAARDALERGISSYAKHHPPPGDSKTDP